MTETNKNFSIEPVYELPETMDAIVFNKYGPPDVLEFKKKKTPKAGDKRIIVKVHYASVNPMDIKLRKGFMKLVWWLIFPYTPGADASGTVVQVGKDVKKFTVGDEVLGWNRNNGTYAEYSAFLEDDLVKKPKNLSFEEAAALPLVSVCTYQSLIDVGKLKKGQKVLIHGASGGVGSVAVQLAKGYGAEVIATCSTDNIEYVKSLGADKVIDYKKYRFEMMTPDVDIVLDLVGGNDVYKRAYPLLKKKKGKFITTALNQPFSFGFMFKFGTILVWRKIKAFLFRTPTYHFVSATPHRNTLQNVMRFHEQHPIKMFISKIFPLKEAKQAHEMMEKRSVRGKMLLKILP